MTLYAKLYLPLTFTFEGKVIYWSHLTDGEIETHREKCHLTKDKKQVCGRAEHGQILACRSCSSVCLTGFREWQR